MRMSAKLLALVLMLGVAFAVNAYASLYFAGYLFLRTEPRPYAEMMSAAIAGAFAAAVIVAWPLARLYSSRAWLAALVVASPVVFLRAGEIAKYWGMNEPRIMLMSWFEMVTYPAVLVAVACLAWRLWRGVRSDV